ANTVRYKLGHVDSGSRVQFHRQAEGRPWRDRPNQSGNTFSAKSKFRRKLRSIDERRNHAQSLKKVLIRKNIADLPCKRQDSTIARHENWDSASVCSQHQGYILFASISPEP